ncbi:hypothetical protein [Pontimicrobium sp. SW4]|uniref:DUF5723 domain-containing protein n=1 Tax=Pontimicrobium sp. SW4 TaxID=3153519 RepID=A0AAU7BQM0_9FLAO
MKNITFITFLLHILCATVYSQEIYSTHVTLKNGISKPSVLSTHPFGVFFSRIQGNFKIHPTKKTQLKINLESGNVWGTQIKTYVPNNIEVRNEVRKHEWHQAQYFFDEETLDTKSYELQIDGVIKGLRLKTSLNLGGKQELNIGLRLFMLSKGKAPFSIITSDRFIENFHEKIAGGSDPFDREVFGYNKALIKYTDRNGNTLELNNNDLFVGGLETSYYYYPNSLVSKTYSMNFGAHLGYNLSSYNNSLDLGLSVNAIKIIHVNDNHYLQIGLGTGILRKELVSFNSNNIDFGTNNYLGNLESIIEYNIISKGNTTHSIGLDYYLQTSLNRRDELEYAIPIRHPNAHKSWGHGVTNLYRNNNYWSLLYSITKKTSLTFYLQQDFEVNNNPDIQTGISYSFTLK